MKKTVIVMLVFAICYYMNGIALGEEKDPKTAKPTPETKSDKKNVESSKPKKIVITATRYAEETKAVPKNIILVDKKMIENSKDRDLGEILDNLLGLDIKSFGTAGTSKSVHIRGSSGSQVLVLLDGRPLNSLNNGETDLSGITLGGLERIEVIKGPSSHLYGANAIGGVINLISKRPDKKPHFLVEAQTGTYGTQLYRVEHSYMPKKFGYLLNLDFARSTGERDNSDFRSFAGMVKFLFDISDKMGLEFAVNARDADYGIPGPVPNPLNIPSYGSASASSLYDRLDQTDHSYSLVWNWEVNRILSTKLNFYLDYRSMDNRLRYDSFDMNFNTVPVKNTSEFDTSIIGGNIDFILNLHEKNKLLVGFDYRRDRLTAWNRDQNFDSGDPITYDEWSPTTNSRGVYLQDEWRIHEKLKFVFGGRMDDHSKYGSDFSSNLGFVISPRQDFIIKTSWGQSYRAPTFNDLYWPIGGNEDLTPEKGQSTEISIDKEFWDGRVELHAGYFYWSVRDKIAWTPDTEGNWAPENVNRQNTHGIELGVAIKLHPQLRFNADFSRYWSDQKDRELVYSDFFTGETRMESIERRSEFMPEYQASSTLSWESTFGFQASLQGVFVGNRVQYYSDYTYLPDIRKNRRELPSYFLANMNLSYSFKKHWKVFLKARNLLDKKYMEYSGTSFDDLGYPMPGRTFYLGLSFDW